MDTNHAAVCAVIAVGAGIFLYAAYSMTDTDDVAVPNVQGEAQVMGLGVGAGMRVNAGTPLDLSFATHFWAPGINPRDNDAPQPTVQSRHRYPAIPGGNVSTVMHKGWSGFCQSAPANDDWRLNPPEVAVL